MKIGRKKPIYMNFIEKCNGRKGRCQMYVALPCCAVCKLLSQAVRIGAGSTACKM